jgi:GMP reductase
MRIDNEIKLDFKDVLIRPKRSTLGSRSEVSLERHYEFKNKNMPFFVGVPIIAANMDSVGTISMARAFYKYNMPVALHKFYDVKTLFDFFQTIESRYCFYTLGISNEDLIKFRTVFNQLENAEPRHMMYGKSIGPQHYLWRVCIDVANGYSERFNRFIKEFRAEFPNVAIMAGNVVTGEMTEELILSGADIVKVGIGPGSVCTTRMKTGVGYPQLSAIIECSDAAHGLGALICGDGGITNSGDVAKAFGAGADFIMCGGLFAGHDESEGTIENDKVKFYGMSSEEAMVKHYNGKANYRASEGKVVYVPYKGKVENTIIDVLGGLRSACTYTGAKSLKQLSKCTTFIRVSQQLNEVFTKHEAA